MVISYIINDHIPENSAKDNIFRKDLLLNKAVILCQTHLRLYTSAIIRQLHGFRRAGKRHGRLTFHYSFRFSSEGCRSRTPCNH